VGAKSEHKIKLVLYNHCRVLRAMNDGSLLYHLLDTDPAYTLVSFLPTLHPLFVPCSLWLRPLTRTCCTIFVVRAYYRRRTPSSRTASTKSITS